MGFRLSWAGGCSWWSWLAMGGFRLRVWLWVGSYHVSGRGAVPCSGLPRFCSPWAATMMVNGWIEVW